MGVIERQSIRGALANYLGVIIGAITTFFVLTDCLTAEEIGLTRVMVDAALLFSGVAQLGTNATIIRYYPYFKTTERGDHGFFGWTMLLPLVGFLLFLLCFLLFREPLKGVFAHNAPMLVDYFYLLIPLTFSATYLTVFEVNANVLLHITVPKFVREVGIRVLNLVFYLLYGHRLISLDLFVILFCSSYTIAALVDFIYLLSLHRSSFRIDFSFMTPALARKILVYTLFMTLTVLAGNIPLINSLFLGAKKSLSLAGIYAIASYIANIVEVPYRSLGAISQPIIAQAVKEGHWDEVNRLGRNVSLHQLLVACLIFFFIWINLQALFAIIPNGDAYSTGIGVVFLLGLAKIINSSFSIGTNILNFSAYYPASLIFITLLTVSAFAFNNYLIPLWGINGAACATLFSYLLYFALLLTFLKVKVNVSLFSYKQLVTLLLMLLLFALNQLWSRFIAPLGNHLTLPPLAVILLDAVIRTAVMAAIATIAVYRLHISDSINRIIRNTLLRIVHPRRHS